MNKFAQAFLMATALVLLPGSAAFAVDNAAVLKVLDPDDDGTIDLPEADAGALKVFKEINPDNDGTLDAKELEGRLTEAEIKAADPETTARSTRKSTWLSSRRSSKPPTRTMTARSISRSSSLPPARNCSSSSTNSHFCQA